MARTIPLLLFTLLLAIPLRAAEQPTVFNQLGYRDIVPGEFQNNLALVRKYVLPTQQALVDAGEIDGWSLFSVQYPIGGDYDTISVTVVSDYTKLTPSNRFRETFDKVHGKKAWAEFIDQIGDLNSLVRTELWQMTRAVGGSGPDPFVRVTTSRTASGAKQAALENLLDTYAAPFWTERLKTYGVSWSTYRLHLPGAGAHGHNNASAVGFADFAGTAPRGDFVDVFNKVHPDAEGPEVAARFAAAATPVLEELWKLEMATR